MYPIECTSPFCGKAECPSTCRNLPKLNEWKASQPLVPFTVWEFRGVSIPGKTIVVKRSEPMESKYQHEYQRILWSGMAIGPADAEAKAKTAQCLGL